MSHKIPVYDRHMNNRVLAFEGKRADKAIIAMDILRLTREATQVKGVGPNRDDKPVFQRVAQSIARGENVPKDWLFRARHRVQKYQAQLRRSQYAALIDSDRPVSEMVMQYERWNAARQADMEMESELLGVIGYGSW